MFSNKRCCDNGFNADKITAAKLCKHRGAVIICTFDEEAMLQVYHLNGSKLISYPFEDYSDAEITSISTIYSDDYIILENKKTISFFNKNIILNYIYIRIFSFKERNVIYTICPPESDLFFSCHWTDPENKILIAGLSNGSLFIHSLTFLKKHI